MSLTSSIMGFAAAGGSSAVVLELVRYMLNRKKLQQEIRIATSTESAQIGIKNLEELQKKLVFLTEISDQLSKENTRLNEAVARAMLRADQAEERLDREVESRRKLELRLIELEINQKRLNGEA